LDRTGGIRWIFESGETPFISHQRFLIGSVWLHVWVLNFSTGGGVLWHYRQKAQKDYMVAKNADIASAVASVEQAMQNTVNLANRFQSIPAYHWGL